ncbi:alpha/beta hydrolase [Actinocrinis puniceicyclus]|uniref:Alpha/beta hydrolase n=1 Tax=Actinocrinis puniceicyclus TaxID=977794 RepID=A0A8J7WPN4_9ACTN|nr:alpha/beta fold hydrolase [Actinocrinis puniceicyclus]MBS2963602.1 alpha/beta hydrolase [Actinocrinis puniceicyclus]
MHQAEWRPAANTVVKHGISGAEEPETMQRRTPDRPGGQQPRLKLLTRDERVTSVALLIHGGTAASRDPVPRGSLALARMRLFAPAILDAAAGHGAAVALLRNRYRGWNEPDGDPVADAGWALDEIGRRYGDVPVALVGHSMGGRAALRVAGHPAVRAVAALAPWLPEGEPIAQLSGRTVLVAHGERDGVTSPAASLAYVRRAYAATDRICFWQVGGARHAMLERPGLWHRLVRDFALGTLGIRALTPELADALDAGALDLGARGPGGPRDAAPRG